MACCQSRPPAERGYATPAALVLSLALALVVTAMMQRALIQLRQARANLVLAQTEYVLSGAQLAAQTAVIRSEIQGPYHWTFTTDMGWVDARAEPEVEKLSLARAAELSDETLLAFGIADPQGLRAELAAAGADVTNVGALDGARLWKWCAARMISPFGGASAYAFRPTAEPGHGEIDDPEPPSWRIGEVWRIQVSTSTGWRDERLVRFTGDARHPAAVIVRWLSRGEGDGGQCDTLLSGV